MSNQARILPRRVGALALWAGSDHYSLIQALKRQPFWLPVDRVSRVYKIESVPFLGWEPRYAIEYRSAERNCFITVERLPEALHQKPLTNTHPLGALSLLLSHCGKEPLVLFLPLVVPAAVFLMALLFLAWDNQVLHNRTVLGFFARPGCDALCVHKVLKIHSLVVLLFLFQLVFLLLPVGLLFFQVPRFRSALNYRMTQSYSLAAILMGAFVFAQLLAFFPFRQYGRFVELGFDPKVERMISGRPTK